MWYVIGMKMIFLKTNMGTIIHTRGQKKIITLNENPGKNIGEKDTKTESSKETRRYYI